MPHEITAMSVWQVFGLGEGFVRGGKVDSFELSGFVQAQNANDAASRAIALAKLQFTDLDQLSEAAWPRPLINWGEIQDASALTLEPQLLDKLELHWASDEA
jgi:hypothetical protein